MRIPTTRWPANDTALAAITCIKRAVTNQYTAVPSVGDVQSTRTTNVAPAALVYSAAGPIGPGTHADPTATPVPIVEVKQDGRTSVMKTGGPPPQG